MTRPENIDQVSRLNKYIDVMIQISDSERQLLESKKDSGVNGLGVIGLLFMGLLTSKNKEEINSHHLNIKN
jgi:plastocyanin domain-containing protein